MIETISHPIPEMAAYSVAFLNELAEWLTSCSVAFIFVVLGILAYLAVIFKRMVSAW